MSSGKDAQAGVREWLSSLLQPPSGASSNSVAVQKLSKSQPFVLEVAGAGRDLPYPGVMDNIIDYGSNFSLSFSSPETGD